MVASRPAARVLAAARPAALAALAGVLTLAAAAPTARAQASSTVGNALVSRPMLDGEQGRVTVLPFAFDAGVVGGRVRSFAFVSNPVARGEGGPDPIQITPLLLALTGGTAGGASYTVVGRGATRVLRYDEGQPVGDGDDRLFTFDFGLVGGSDVVTAATRVGFALPYFQRGVVLYCENDPDNPDAACGLDGGPTSAFAQSEQYQSSDYPRRWLAYNASDLNAGGPQAGDTFAVAREVQRAYSIQFTADQAAAVATVPEPGTVALLGAGLAGVVLVGRRRGAAT